MSAWGPWCVKCGHPASYHGESFCVMASGGEKKQPCDCGGYKPYIAEVKE